MGAERRKRCTGCGENMILSHFSSRVRFYERKDGGQSKYVSVTPQCGECLARKSRKYRDRHPGWSSAIQMWTMKMERLRVLREYGGVCVCCGETRYHFLAMDHIAGDGAQHRREIGLRRSHDIYSWLRKRGFPKDNFQILCHNCNNAKGLYGMCPHSKERLGGGVLGIDEIEATVSKTRPIPSEYQDRSESMGEG